MLFMDKKSDRELEQIMRSVPNFTKRGGGFVISQFGYKAKKCDCQYCVYSCGKVNPCGLTRCDCLDVPMQGRVTSHKEILSEVLGQIKHPAFIRRFHEYILQSESDLMKFRNGDHLQAFDEVIDKIDRKNFPLLSALYLLTANQQLWKLTKNHINRKHIYFEEIKLKGIDEYTYTLYCAAKDLFLGTKHLYLSDLADKNLVTSSLFKLICNAMAIRRCGAEFLKKADEEIF